ncbi:LacI family transcriptional regulator [Chloroflexi bacterium TSY]|nr:LacI family transcriptional regulator [Chloroflexi bacterium TSY]
MASPIGLGILFSGRASKLSHLVITLKDIARSAGVSHATVSRTLRGDTRIPPNTTDRIVRLANEMGYVPNSFAQSQHTQQTFTIRMLVTSIADPVVMDFVEGAESVAQDRGYSIFISTSRSDPVRVLLDSEKIDDERPSVNVDNVGGAAFAVKHLLASGHRRIGYIGAPNRPLTNEERLLGYKQSLEQAQIVVDPGWVTNFDVEDDIHRGRLGLEHLLEAGVTYGHLLLQRPDRHWRLKHMPWQRDFDPQRFKRRWV